MRVHPKSLCPNCQKSCHDARELFPLAPPSDEFLTGWLAGREAAAAKLDAIAAELGELAADPRMLVEEVDIYEAEQLVVEEDAKRIRAIPAPGKGEVGDA